MAIINRSSFALVLTALLSSSVSGQSSINFDNCARTEDTRARGTVTDFTDLMEGSQMRTYGLLCSGTSDDTAIADTDIQARVGHPFKRLCELIDRFDNVKNLMSIGSSPHTVFAPTDSAFSKIDGLISRVDEEKLLELHILPQARLTRDLRCGQTYRTVNTQQDRRSNQRSKTRCVSAARSQQLGPGNVVNGLKPTIGNPGNIFRADEFGGQENFVLFENSNAGTVTADQSLFSQDAIACNGVVHVVDEVLLPGGRNALSNPVPYNNYGVGVQGNNNGGYYYGGAQTNYYGPNHVQGQYYDGPARAYRGYYNAKKGKGGKGAKRGLPRRAPARRGYNAGVYYRKLEGDNTADADEMFMTDAEFFGTNGSVENDAKAEDTENRKRRLEALLQPDGNIAVV